MRQRGGWGLLGPKKFQARYRRAQALVKSRRQCMSALQQTLNEVKQVFLINSCEVAAWCRNIHDMT